MTFEVIAFTTPKVLVEDASDEVKDDLYEEVEIIDEDMGGELEESTMVNMELDEKKSTKLKGKNKGVKRKHNESATQKNKENSKKECIRRIQAFNHKWKEKREIPLPTATT